MARLGEDCGYGVGGMYMPFGDNALSC